VCKKVVGVVVRSVVRRSRLGELGVSRASFRAAGVPVPVGATVQIPSDKHIKATVTFENTGSQSVSGNFMFYVFYADTLSNSTGDPESDWNTWDSECDVSDSSSSVTLTLNPGSSESLEGLNPPAANTWAEGTKIDAGVVLLVGIGGEIHFLDSLKIADAVEIVAPTLRVEITDVTFSETD